MSITNAPRSAAIILLMAVGRVSFQTGYAGVVRSLAEQALAVARDAAPHRAREGERRWPMAMALPAARVLIDSANDADHQALAHSAQGLALTLADPTGSVTDGFGHARPVYRWLALHLLASAARLSDNSAAMDHVAQAARVGLASCDAGPPSDPRLLAWRNLVAWQHGLPMQPDTLSPPSGTPAPLVPLGLNDLIDTWTYNELLGLHAFFLHAQLRNDEHAVALAKSAALFHLGHTQPDYTTYQPWALSAFASDAQTAVFAEQQLHDVATHLRLEGPGGAVLPALLLADASATMTNDIKRAWLDR